MQRDYSNATSLERKLYDNVRIVRDRIGEACVRAHRDPDTVELVAVTKTVGLNVVRTLRRLDIRDLGENRVQQLVDRAEAIGSHSEGTTGNSYDPVAPARRWHMIGSLQRNKVRSLLPWVSLIHSVDRLRLAEEIDKRAGELPRRIDVLLEVSGANEPAKGGAAVCAAGHLGEQIVSMPNLRLRGLMTMAPLTADRSVQRNAFLRVSELFAEMRSDYAVGDVFDTLSMGMSGDFEVAIECGSTQVRVGSALFDGISPAELGLPDAPS